MKYTFKSKFGTDEYLLEINMRTYPTGNPMISLIDCADGFPYAMATVNFPNLQPTEVAIKDYSENEGVLDFLLANHIIEQPHRYIQSGWVNIPVCKLK